MAVTFATAVAFAPVAYEAYEEVVVVRNVMTTLRSLPRGRQREFELRKHANRVREIGCEKAVLDCLAVEFDPHPNAIARGKIDFGVHEWEFVGKLGVLTPRMEEKLTKIAHDESLDDDTRWAAAHMLIAIEPERSRANGIDRLRDSLELEPSD